MKTNKITTIVFCALIGSLTIASMLNPVKKSSETENRELAQMPEISVKTIFDGSFEKDYETFITDQFVARGSPSRQTLSGSSASANRTASISRTTTTTSKTSPPTKRSPNATSGISRDLWRA